MAQTTDNPKLLIVHMAAKLHLSQTEYKALKLIAEANNCTIEDVINGIIHRSVHAELETTVPKSYLLERLEAENDQVFEEANKLEQVQADASTIEVLTPIRVSKAKYEQFRRIFDEQSWQDFASWAAGGGGLLDEVIGENSDIMADFLKDQHERLYGKKED